MEFIKTQSLECVNDRQKQKNKNYEKSMLSKFSNSKLSADVKIKGGDSNYCSETYVRTTYVSKNTDAIKTLDGANGAVVTYVQYY